MKNKTYRLSLFTCALLATYPAFAANQFGPFPPTPLNLQPKPAQQVPPNTLFFLDNSYDSCKGSKTNWLCDAVTGEAMAGRNEDTKLTAVKKVIEELVTLSKYEQYRFGAAGYPTGKKDSQPYVSGKQCGVLAWAGVNKLGSFDNLYSGNTIAGYHNWRVTPCYAEEYKALLRDDYAEVKSAHNTLKANETGALIYVPITNDKSIFTKGLDNLPKYKDMDSGYSPMSSAYLELTRYYRGLTSGTDKHRFKTNNGSATAWNSNNEYISPIEYRCQQNNIVFISSAEDIRLYDPRLEVASFYKAYHEDPLYKHNSRYSAKGNKSLESMQNLAIKFEKDSRPKGQPHSEFYTKHFDKYPALTLKDMKTIKDANTDAGEQESIYYNPFFDHITNNKIDFLQYHERRSIEGFAHLAFFSGSILENADGVRRVNGKDTDKEGMKWDGTSSKDNIRNGFQNIRTFAVNYQLKPVDFPELKIKAHGITDADKWNRQYIRFAEKPDYPIDDGDCVYYKNQPLIAADGKFITTGVISAVYDKNIGPYIHLSAEPPEYIKPGGEIQIVSKAQMKKGSCIVRDVNDTGAAKLLSRTGLKGGGGFYSVSSTNLKDVLEGILDQIAPANVSVDVGGALASNDAKISTAITPTLDSARWVSQLRFYNMPFNSNNFTVPDYSKDFTTLISTSNGVKSLSESSSELNNEIFNIGDDFNLPAQSKVNHEGKGQLKVANSSRPDEWRNLVKWLLQTTPNDRDNAFKSAIFGIDQLIYRDRDPHNTGNRGHLLGDVLDSNILTFGGEEHPVTGSDGKKTYGTGDNNPYLAVGANDGMVHIYQSNKKGAQNPHPYFHKFAYIPGTARRTSADDTIIRNLVYTAEQNYGTQANPHQYFVNGGLFYRKTDSGLVGDGNADKGQMMIVGSLGQGGRAAYSLNIGGFKYGSETEKVGLEATSGDEAKNILLWDTSTNQFGNAKAGVDDKMGYPIGSPQVGRVATTSIEGETAFNKGKSDVRYATFLNSGVDSGGKPTLFVLDQLGVNVINRAQSKITAGSLIKKIEAGGDGGLMAPHFVDYNRDGITDFVYAGDTSGNMWRFDLRGGENKWKAIKIYQGDKTQPITTSPRIFYNGKGSKIHVFFGTGSALYQKDFKDKNQQAMFGIVDDISCKENCTVITKSNLTERTLSPNTGEVTIKGNLKDDGTREDSTTEELTYRTIKDIDKKDIEPLGWYVPLALANGVDGSERIVVNPVVIADQYLKSGTVLFTTRIFKDVNAKEGEVSCMPPPVEIGSWVMGLDVHTGGSPKRVNLQRSAPEGNIVGYLVAGQASEFLNTSTGLEIDEFGGGASGVATPLESPNERVVKVRRMCRSDGIANTAITVQNPDGSSTITRFDLDCGKPTFRRLGWREIF